VSQDESDHDGQRIHRAREAVGQIVNTVRHRVGAGDEAARLINHQHDEQSWPLHVPNQIPCLRAYLRVFRAAFVTGTTVMADATPALFWRGKADRQHLGTTPVRPHRLHGLSISRCLRYAARRLALVSTP